MKRVLLVPIIASSLFAAEPQQSASGEVEDIVLPDLETVRAAFLGKRIRPSDDVEKAHIQALSDARRDIAAGKLIHISYGLKVEPEKIAKLMLARYGIEMQEKGCVSFPDSDAYAHVYNALMEEAIRQKFGRSFEDLFEPVWLEVTAKRPNQPPEPTATSVTPPAAQESRQP